MFSDSEWYANFDTFTQTDGREIQIDDFVNILTQVLKQRRQKSLETFDFNG